MPLDNLDASALAAMDDTGLELRIVLFGICAAADRARSAEISVALDRAIAEWQRRRLIRVLP